MSYIPLLNSTPRNALVGGRRRTSAGCRAEGPTSALATVAPAYTADSARLAAAALMRLFMDQGVPGFGFADPQGPEDGPGTAGGTAAVPVGAADGRGAAGPDSRAARASTAAASGSPAPGRTATAQPESPLALRRRRRRVRFARRGLVTGRTRAEEDRHGRPADTAPPATAPGGPAAARGGEEER
ncbi:hypothetical protein ACIF80_32660 [Streptomyces sp. NPDC085927]|uniref:hypothetical protein n=1 Tax=Streptomyces sp. NPDC085927 TaxID=3365738 RepID=UPI0037D4D958